MSQFTSKKVKINYNEHLNTLLAECGGDYETKIWILDDDFAWTGELSSAEAKAFISRYKLTEKVFLDELQKALMFCDCEIIYSLEDKEPRGHTFSWKRALDTGISIKNGEIKVVKVTLQEAYEEVLDRCLENNSLLLSQINTLKKERDTLLAEKNEVLSSYEKAVEQKKTFEQTLYCQFLAVLNTKKDKIRELQAEVDKLAQLKESSARVLKKSVGTKKKDSIAPSLRKKTEDRQMKIQDSTTKNEAEAVRDTKSEDDPNFYDVDTDLDDDGGDCSDNACGEPSTGTKVNRDTKPQLHSQNSGELFDSFEEVSSPVAVLPKRSKLNVKETVTPSLTSGVSVSNKPSTSHNMDVDRLLDSL